MNDILLIVHKEWAGFSKSDRGVFIVYALLVFAWSFLLSMNMSVLGSEAGYLWFIFFSVIVSGNFSNTTFIAERMGGSLEILLCCGISRRALVTGKIAYIIIMSTILGCLCYLSALGILIMRGEDMRGTIRVIPVGKDLLLYGAACFMNATCGAWLSVRINNPRLLPFINLFVMGLIIILYTLLSVFYFFSEWALVVVLIGAGVVFTILSFKEFAGERVIQPIVY